MAKLVGAFAASHAPLIAREWDNLAPSTRDVISRPFDEMSNRLSALKPDVLVMLSPDHWVNFFLDNFPSFCVGVGPEHDGRVGAAGHNFGLDHADVHHHFGPLFH